MCPWSCASLLFSGFVGLRSALPNANAQDDELRRISRRQPDFDVESTQRLCARRIERFIDADIERLRGGAADQRAALPHARQEFGNGSRELLPEGLVVRFENSPANAPFDGLLEIDEQAANVDVLPARA